MSIPGLPTVSIIIVNWNGCHHLADCLDSLSSQSYRDFEVILVDNGSIDGSVEFVQAQYPWVGVIPLRENTGFAHGNNVGLENSRGRYVVTLNNDTRVAADWLFSLVKVADAHPEAGMIGSRICSFSDPDNVDSLGVLICRDGMSRGAYRQRSFASLGLEGVMEILLPSACAALYRREMLEQVGFFDEDFFAYCEDTDLGLRCRLAGWNALLALDAVVLHKYSGTSGAFSVLKIYLAERNHYWVTVKIFPWSRLLLLPLVTAQRFLLQTWGVLTGRGTGGEFVECGSKAAVVGAIIRATFAALHGLPAAWGKRRGIRRRTALSQRQLGILLDKYRLSFRVLLGL